MSPLGKLTSKDFLKSVVMIFVSTMLTSIGGSMLSILDQLQKSISAGVLTIDFRAIGSSIAISVIAGIMLGITTALTYLVKNLLTDESGKFLGVL